MTADLTVSARTADGNSQPGTTVSASRSWVVGRSVQADIVVDDDRVSRQHLVLEPLHEAWLVRDISSNGSWHAGSRIGREGLAVPPFGELRVNLGNPAGPEIVITSNARAAAPVVPAAAAIGPGRRRRHPGRWIAGGIAVVLLLLTAADRIAAHLAATEAVSQVVQQSQGLSSRPSVSFGGFPFLTQVAFGRYSDIKVGINDLQVSGSPHIQRITGELRGAHIPLSKAIHDNVTSIPVDHIRATVTMGFADLNSYLKDQPGHLVLASNGSNLTVTGSVDVLGQSVTVSGTGQLGVTSGGLTVSPTGLNLGGTATPGDLGLGDLASIFPPVPIPFPDLPFHLRLTAVAVRSDGLQASAAADDVVLTTGSK
jgi:LmeA-like phospholipid-binding/FHA domain